MSLPRFLGGDVGQALGRELWRSQVKGRSKKTVKIYDSVLNKGGETDMKFVKNFTRPYFWTSNFTHLKSVKLDYFHSQ